MADEHRDEGHAGPDAVSRVGRSGRPIRVLHVVYALEIGGSELLARDISIRLIGRGMPAGVCAVYGDGPLASDLEAAGAMAFAAGRVDRQRLRPMLRLWQAFRSFRPDIVHTHHLHELAFAWPGALACGARIVHTEHEFYSLMKGRTGRLLRLLSPLCGAVTGVNAETTAFMRDRIGVPRRRLFTIENGIDIDRFAGGHSIRAELGLPGDGRIVGVVARLEAVKGHAVLLRALGSLSGRRPGIHLLVVGDGSERESLRRIAADLGIVGRVHFVGRRQDIPDLLATMDAFVLPSLEEGLPLSILEAMAARRVTVATAVGGIPSVIRHRETGLLVPPGDVDNLAAAMEEVLFEEDLGSAMVEAAFQVVSERFDLRETLSRYLRLYETVLRE